MADEPEPGVPAPFDWKALFTGRAGSFAGGGVAMAVVGALLQWGASQLDIIEIGTKAGNECAVELARAEARIEARDERVARLLDRTSQLEQAMLVAEQALQTCTSEAP